LSYPQEIVGGYFFIGAPCTLFAVTCIA